MSSNPIKDLNKIYLEAVYGQSAGQKLEKREKDDDAAGAPRKATPASGTGKYYKEGKPTDQQLAQRKKREKIKQLTNQGKHKEASALHNEDAKYGYDKDGNSLNPVDIEKRKKKDDDLAGSPNYETKKKAEVLSAMKKQGRKLSDKEKSKIADKVVKDKGDTSKSDDRYAYEELQNIRALVEKKEVKVKDTRRTVDAIRAYDKSKDASRDADWDTEHGEKEKGDIEKKYAKKERGEIDKDDPNWKKRKYHTGMHGEEVEQEGEVVDEDIAKMGANVTDALPWNRNTKYTTKGKPRKAGENIHGKQTGKGLNTSTSRMGKVSEEVEQEGEVVDEGIGAALLGGALATGLAAKGIQTIRKIKNDAKSRKPNTIGGTLQNRTNRLNQMMNQSYEPEGEQIVEADVFEVIKDYLIREKFASDENSAIAIMSSMSEGWRESILEEAPPRDVPLWGPGPTPKSNSKPKPSKVQKKPTPQPRDEPLW